MTDEETTRSSIATRMQSFVKRAPISCKIVELVLCIVSMGLIMGPFSKIPHEDMNRVAIFYVGVCGYILINSILIAGHLFGERLPKKTALIFSGMGAILCCAAGFVLIHDWTNFPNNLIYRYEEQYSNQMVSSGFFAVLAALAFALDTYFINKSE